MRVGLVMLMDRLTERSALDLLLACARGGMSSALVLRGEPGVGKTALLVPLPLPLPVSLRPRRIVLAQLLPIVRMLGPPLLHPLHVLGAAEVITVLGLA